MARGPEVCPGVRELDHTADLGIVVHARTLPELFHRAALGASCLLRGAEGESDGETEGEAGVETGPLPAGSGEGRSLALEAADLPELLVKWLREILYYAEAESLEYRGARFEKLAENRLRALVRVEQQRRPPIREIKGVTYHGLEAAGEGGEWHARIIFDV